MRVAFTLIGGKDLTGGYNYLLNIMHVLGQHQVDRLTPILFVGEVCTEGDITPLATIPRVEFVRTPLLNGTTVEEARSMGTPMLLSDLDVHREQMGEDAFYFDRHSAQSLADALDGFVPLDESQRALRAEAAREAALRHVERFSRDFTDLAGHCQPGCGRP